MVTSSQIGNCIKWSLQNIHGNISEKIIQNAMMYKLRSIGIECQQEVVLPILSGNVFLGYNRFDIFIPSQSNGKSKITIIELKLLSGSIKKGFEVSRTHEQCAGYKACASRIFGNDAHMDVYVVNTWRIPGVPVQYKHEVIRVASKTQRPPMCIKTRKNGRQSKIRR